MSQPDHGRRALVRGARDPSSVAARAQQGCRPTQRDSSALHYHFASREGLLRAIVAKHTEYIRERRLELIDELDVRYGPVDVRSAVRVLVEPITTPLEHGRSGAPSRSSSLRC